MARETKKVLFVSDDEFNQINAENKSLFDEFMMYCQTVDLSKETIKVYRSNLRIFFVWYHKNCRGKSFIDVKKRDLMAFQNYLVTNGLSPSRVRILRSSISSISNFIENVLDDEFPDFRNITNKIPAPTLNPVREKTVMEEAQLEELLEKLISLKKYQVACFVAMAAYTGARKSELVQYKRSFFTDDSVKGGLYVTPQIRTKGKGSMGKMMSKYGLKFKLDKYLELWDKERERLGVDIDDLFIVRDGDGFRPAQQTTVDSYMKLCSKLLDMDCYCHSFRHFFVSNLVRADIPLEVIRDLVGHNDSSTTEIYNDVPKEDGFMKYFGEDGINKVEKKAIEDLQ